MANFKAVAAVFVVLAVIFGTGTAYFLAYPAVTKTTTTVTTTTTRTVVSTQSITSTVTAAGPPSATVNIAYKSGIGFYLTNGTGFSLYFRSTDKPNTGTTTCTTDTCEKNWPVFYVSNLELPPGLNSSAFGVITAYNSTKIATYDGFPLFYWLNDVKPGDTLGQGIGGFHLVTVPAPITSVTTSTTSTTSSTSASTSPAAAKVQIPNGASSNQSSLGNLGFYPNTITVVIGVNNTVTWTNNDVTTHTVTSLSVPAGAKAFNDGSLGPGSTFSVTLTVAGTYEYHCAIHPWMIGKIIVKSP